MKLNSALIFSLALVGVNPFAAAQIPDASRQVDSVEQRRQFEQAARLMSVTNPVPELYAGEASDVGPQTLLQKKMRRQLFTAFADAQFFFTDNLFLADHNPHNSAVLVSTVQAAFTPPPFKLFGGEFSQRLGYQHQWFNYGLAGSDRVLFFDFKSLSFATNGLDALDFNVQTVFSDTTAHWGGFDFTAGFDYRRLLDASGYREFYHEFMPRLSVRREFVIDDNKAVAIGYEGDYRFTESQLPPAGLGTDFNNRTDHSLVLVGSWRLCEHAFLQPSYRVQYSYFPNVNRQDWLNTVGLALYCPLTQNIALRIFASYDTMHTDGFFTQSYDKLDLGGGVNLSVSF